MNTAEWVRSITDDHTKDIATRAGISDRTLRHQMSVGTISVENVIRIANAYGHNPLRVLINMGVADESWARIEDIEGALRRATDEQLTDEFLRRLKVAPNPEWDTSVGDLEAARRAKESNCQVPPRPADEEDDTSLGRVAYSGEDEDAQRQKEDGDFD